MPWKTKDDMDKIIELDGNNWCKALIAIPYGTAKR